MSVSAFDSSRILSFALPFQPLINPGSAPIRDVISQYGLEPHIRVLVMTLPENTLVFSTAQMVYYHVAQGRAGGQPWLITYCVVCNAGSCFSPVIDGVEYQLNVRGMYNAMTLLKDEQTGSYWEIVKGECLYGPMIGKKFTQLESSLLHMSLEQAIERYPDADLIFSPVPPEEEAEVQAELDNLFPPRQPDDLKEFVEQINFIDNRLPALDIGLGVWTVREARYYSFSSLNASNNLLVDHFDNRTLIVYIDLETGIPGAFYADATNAQWRGDQLVLSNRQTLRGGVLYSPEGERVPMEQPWQLFHRWYSFSLSFPEGTIYRRS